MVAPGAMSADEDAVSIRTDLAADLPKITANRVQAAATSEPQDIHCLLYH
jgi:hypothetical protein